MKKPGIRKIEAVIDAKAALDMFGKGFRFDHVKGLAEWLKNSVDAYLRDGAERGVHCPDSDHAIIIRLRRKTRAEPIRFECIDFSGTTRKAIANNFIRWFDKTAARRGMRSLKTYGGHGNGGKFYMRQMFETSRFITYRSGLLNVFGFDEEKDYGFLDGFEDRRLSPEDALVEADLADLAAKLPASVMERLRSGGLRFTVVRGCKPHAVGVKRYNAILDRLRVHPQARGIIQAKPVYGMLDDGELVRLLPEVIKPKPGFEEPAVFEMPERLPRAGGFVTLANERFGRGRLTLYTSEEPFGRNDDRAGLNCISFKGAEIGVIASYRISELGGPLRNYEMAEFIYGECECPILEDPAQDHVQNDREHLVKSDVSGALLGWICERINELASRMVERVEREEQREGLANTVQFNVFLNEWKNRFLQTAYGEIFTGSGPGVGGFAGGTGEAVEANAGAEAAAAHNPKPGGTGDRRTKGRNYPRVLLSNHDKDPFDGSRVTLDAAQPIIYQRPEDKERNIYWINTNAPLARKIRVDYGQESVHWREYLFQRYVEIIIKQGIRECERRGEQLTAGKIDGVLDEVCKRLYAAAAEKELDDFLFKK
ncbi:MAG: hypothetical protein HY894_07505 [Deltaproteobacteria bacterium]|nr:hypothetical protein [Deltaproteobacteria bacterium]